MKTLKALGEHIYIYIYIYILQNTSITKKGGKSYLINFASLKERRVNY